MFILNIIYFKHYLSSPNFKQDEEENVIQFTKETLHHNSFKLVLHFLKEFNRL